MDLNDLYLQGPPWLSGQSKLALRDRNMHGKSFLKVVLWCQKMHRIRISEPHSKTFQHAYFYLSELIYFIHLVMADPVVYTKVI